MGQSLKNEAQGDQFPRARSPRVKNSAFQGQPRSPPGANSGLERWLPSLTLPALTQLVPKLHFMGTSPKMTRNTTHNHGNLARVQIQSAYAGVLNGGKAWGGISSETCHFLFCLQQRKCSWREERERGRQGFTTNQSKLLRNHKEEFCWEKQLKTWSEEGRSIRYKITRRGQERGNGPASITYK